MNEFKSESKKGLGQGLAAILGTENYITKNDLVQELAIDSIVSNPHQPRKHFKEAEIQELAQSISRTGVLQPIIVREQGPNRYEIVAGERRWRAAQQANLHKIPVVIKKLDDAQAFTIALVENIQRSDLNPVEEADGYQLLMDQMQFTQEKIAEMVGKSRPHIANTLRLNSLSKHIRALVANGDLTAGHAKALIGIENADGLAELMVKRQLNVRQAERLVRRIKRKDASTVEDLNKLADAIISSAPANEEESINTTNNDPEEEKIRGMVAQALPYAQVEFYFHERKPGLRIQFKNLGDLDAFLEKLL